ncbi:MAG: Trk system potassium transporter TrkA [Desulfuromonadales bacterium]|nr:Trk system potassium transporter TrkA [Desulfuromonadales bacterium]
MNILIVGAGQVGFFLCERLSLEGHDVTLIDRDQEQINEAQDRLNVMGVLGNGASAETMEQAGIKEADIVMAVTDLDEVNILACLLAREYGVGKRIARVKSIDYLSRGAVLSKDKLGIDLMINPDDAVADELANLAGRVGAFDVAEFVEGQMQFLGYRITKESPLCDLTLKELGEIRGMYRFVVVAISRGGHTIIPRGDDTIQVGDSIFLFAHKEELPSIQYMLQIEEEQHKGTKRAFILGGGRIGQRVARALEEKNVSVRLIERDQQRCEELSAKLKKTMVIHADGADIRVLLDEGVENADVFIAATENDETNILCALLCKRQGAHRTLCLVNRPEYLDLAPSLGVDACVSPRLSAAGAILKFARRGNVLSLATIEGSNSEVLEIEVKSDSSVINTPLKDLNFPRGAIIGAIVHGKSYDIPDGENQLKVGDRVLVFALPEAISKVERFFD